MEIKTFDKFKKYLTMEAKDVLVGVNGKEEIVGCCYLEHVSDNMGSVAVFTRREALLPTDIIDVSQSVVSYYFQKHSLKMLYGVTRASNRAAIRLMKRLGFSGFQTLKESEKVEGKFMDCILGGIIREKIGNH
ncbi:GNAT family N-acetyltransferase [Methanolobus sp.]|uniref:GNAT family N-acetyltransferase n=1 Tax=Methanolobus sp. TaxID=1874737 RepID=UPI0035230615